MKEESCGAPAVDMSADGSEEENDQECSYKVIAESFKERGNGAMTKGDVQEAITLYTQAIEVDPDNHIYYSNRSAAHMKADSISKALKDAERCVALAPAWPKGYSRLGAAQHGLRRLEAAVTSFKRGIELEPTNEALWRALRSVEDAQQLEREARHKADAAERAALEDARSHRASRPAPPKTDELEDFFSAVSSVEKGGQLDLPPSVASSDPQVTAAPVTTTNLPPEPLSAGAPAAAPEEGEDDLLASFFSEVTATVPNKPSTAQVEQEKRAALLTDKYLKQDLGSPMDQYTRLTEGNYKWRNLNPYETLQLGIDATVEDIKYRYKKLSAKVHPDKLRDAPLARDGFEEVKNAYLKLMDEQQRDNIIMNIEFITEEAEKERRRLLNKGVKESALPPLSEDVRHRLLKHFADIEFKKRKSEQNIHAHNSREKMFVDMEKQQQEAFDEFDKKWADGDRREKRVGNWRDFQSDPEAKRTKAASYKEEERGGNGAKHGQVKVETWKKKWK